MFDVSARIYIIGANLSKLKKEGIMKILKYLALIMASIALFSGGMGSAFAAYDNKIINADDRYIYIGTEFGFSEPVVKSFEHKSDEGDTTMRLKQSQMYGGRIGYSFYPNMLIGLSGTHQPKYRLGYKLPEIDITDSLRGLVKAKAMAGGATEEIATNIANARIADGTKIPSISDITRVSSNVFMINLTYEIEKQALGMKPYVILGAGIAQVNIRGRNTAWTPSKDLANLDAKFASPIEFFKVKKKNNNCLAYQFGLGVTRDVTPNISIDLGARLQVVKDIKIEYQTLNLKEQKYEDAAPIKKTIGVGEFTCGIIFKMPV